MATAERSSHALRFHGLADETRLRIVEILSTGERCVCELTSDLDLGQSLLSFHLKTLKQAGLVTDRREGRWMYYALNEAGLREMAVALTRLTVRPKRPRRPPRCEPGIER